MKPSELKPNHIVRSSLLAEPVRGIALVPMGDSIKLIGDGMHLGKIHQPIITSKRFRKNDCLNYVANGKSVLQAERGGAPDER